MADILRDMLAQQFTFLGRGAKVHAYGSADSHFVLKTLNTPAQTVDWYAGDNDLARLTAATGCEDPLEAASILLANGETSYRLAASALHDETGLLFLHLDPTHDIGLQVDIDGRPPLDADRDKYIVQHRAELVRTRIDARERAGDRDASLRVLDDIIDLIARIWRRGITEDSFNFHNNYGYVGQRLIQVDIGEFHRSWDRVRAEAHARKILRQKSQAWLARKYPPLAEALSARVRERLTPAALGIE